MDVVLHAKLVLYEVGVRIYLLMWIFWQWSQTDVVRTPVVVVAGSPLRTVTVGAPHADEELLATLYVGVVEIAGTGNGESAVPYHEVVELVVAHLCLELMPGIVELVGTGSQ